MNRSPARTLRARLRRPAGGDPELRSHAATGDTTSQLQAVLIVNPYSSGMTPRREREIVSILREHTKLDVRRTERPNHAPELVQRSIESGVDLVIACGGDGTGNEVLNGMGLETGSAEHSPLFALIPAGGTNVLTRSLGLPNDPIRATRVVAEAIAEGRSQTINLGKLDERIFMFSAGIGFDGELVRRMESRRTGRRPGDLAHMATVGAMFMHERLRFDERLTVRVPETGSELRAAFVMCGNTSPLTYVGKVPVHLTPDCTLQTGLDFIAPRRLNPLLLFRSGLRSVGKRAARRDSASAPDVQQLHHDIEAFEVVCDEPTPVQVDGEYLGDRTHLSVTLVREAVRLVH